MNTITIRVSPVVGGGSIITCSESFTPADVAEELQIEVPENFELIFAHKGRILSSYLTLQFQGVTTGSTVIYNSRQTHAASPPLNFPFTDYAAEEDLEGLRLADLGFANWEPCREFLGIAREMVREQEAEEEDITDLLIFPTIVKPALKIADTPLPPLFTRKWRPCDYF
jgi:hypothetical protein